MLIITGQMWPQGNPAASYELLHATISNTGGGPLDASYMAHVLVRPYDSLGVSGYEADVAVTGHRRRDGVAPLLATIFHEVIEDHSNTLPEASLLKRLWLRGDFDWQRARKG